MSNSFSRILFIAKRECRRLIANPVYVLGMVVFPILVTVLFTSLMDEGQPEEMPVGVVDLDNTSFTRKLTRSLDAFQTTHIVARYPNVEEARKAMQQGNPDEKETMAGARGADYEGMKIHSVRLPGYVASQEVIFGGQGETLKISTDPINRECYMPGVALGCRKIVDQVGLVYGLDKLL